MEINVEVPDPETPPVETPPVVAVVAPPATTPEAPTDLAVSVGTLLAKMETVETTLNGVKFTAEDALSTARLALERQAATEVIEETPVIEEIAPSGVVVEGDPVTPRGKRHWVAELFL